MEAFSRTLDYYVDNTFEEPSQIHQTTDIVFYGTYLFIIVF